ncbi:MAG: lipopolysaccharide assembly protein LapA domain-containing protein [Candidatus Latescibacteria bacterium]|nr:lipopolysaccharide assembly protein LapA domain-containing protein [Candidatus Latescibacterota bacterium]
MRTLRTIVVVLLFAFLLIVMIQNAQPVTFNFLNWHYEVSQLLLVVIVFVVGWLSGFIAAKLTRKKTEDEPSLTPRPR